MSSSSKNSLSSSSSKHENESKKEQQKQIPSSSSSSSSYIMDLGCMPVVLYLPNIMGYIRILMAFWGLYESSSSSSSYSSNTEENIHSKRAIVIWILSASLDFFDGLVARNFNQTSNLGIYLDIAADNILRSVIWIAAAISAASSSSSSSSSNQSASIVVLISSFIICLEWMTMLSTQLHSSRGGEQQQGEQQGKEQNSHWKEQRSKDPKWIQYLFSNNFINPLGILTIYGLFTSGLFVYASFTFVSKTTTTITTTSSNNSGSMILYSLFMYISYIGRCIGMIVELWFTFGYLQWIVENDDSVSMNRRCEKKE